MNRILADTRLLQQQKRKAMRWKQLSCFVSISSRKWKERFAWATTEWNLFGQFARTAAQSQEGSNWLMNSRL